MDKTNLPLAETETNPSIIGHSTTAGTNTLTGTSTSTDVISICGSANEVESVCKSNESTENPNIKSH